ncbi:bifunctional adenosylcobinamide kinase/adenosylcobinamide-phosphate guanylyltransferase [Filibacter tadaridae]|uniref:Adenosylcobinamide kinase/adenosylcobinamide-phosphate guanylyltransferase n=1 Tax=Filibacter tadaridae TaxID=2483811 RepID=A0A3P5WTW2_9BACL|nr:bifunctional adenosylcobinamide kinase/adenosylcobinamide-phosphate guanylyltransferase [Filibacter tadaridae]VDC19386.1 adenosylcobinamide kinase/adenosylcobinamide-phosphate guanylyltransferase [Filibacter tadaridae]
MHIYIGGAHNGKRHYVRTKFAHEKLAWFDGELPETDTFINHKIVIAGLENWLAQTDLDEQQAIEHIMRVQKDRSVIIILTDIGRGIVPMDADQRKLRDTCGRLYQRLIAEADEVTRIWYGLAQTVKKRGEKQ